MAAGARWQRDTGGHGRGSHRHRSAATARRHSGDEDTSGDSNHGGTDINQQSTKSSRQWWVHLGSATPAGMAEAAAATTVLPPRAATVVMKTLAVTTMVGAQTTIYNQIKASTGTATEMAKMTATTKRRRRQWQRRWRQGKRGSNAEVAASLAAMAAAW